MIAFTSYHLFVPHPPMVWRQCDARGCKKQATWLCYVHGDLAQAKGLCEKHKQEIEQQEAKR